MYLSPFKRKKKKPDRLELVKNNTLKRVGAFRKHFSKKNKDDNFIQFLHVVRLFFAELFKIKYEFTFEELGNELERRRIDQNLKEKILFFLKKLSVVEYSDERLPDSELRRLLNEFLKLFEKLTFNEQKVKETRLDKILRFLKIKRLTKKKEAEKKQHVSSKRQEKTAEDHINFFVMLKKAFSIRFKILPRKSRLEQVHDMLIKALDMLDNNQIQKSKQLYVKIKEKYNQLDIEDKKDVYDDILLLYTEIVSVKRD